MHRKLNTAPCAGRLLRLVLIFSVVLGTNIPSVLVHAASPLSIMPLTWNVVGLDSNNVKVGPNNFPVGARVCNTGAAVSNLEATFTWDSSNDLIDLRDGSLNPITLSTLGAGTLAAPTCSDFYFEVSIERNVAAYNTTREYHITVTSSGGTLTTPRPREIFVEHLISQNRNSTDTVTLNGVPYGPGTSLPLQVGGTYTIELGGSTATQGYNQVEDFINFPNTIFQILSVATHYTANSSTFVANSSEMLYGDACLYDPNPDSPTYRSCIGSDGKIGGTIITTYVVKIIGGAGSTQSLDTLIYDFSGSSYHYNSDFSSSARMASISTALTVSKAFTPASIQPNGESTLAITINNAGGSDAAGVSLVDPLPTFPAMTVASTPGVVTSADCQSPVVEAVGGANRITFSGGVAAHGACTIQVQVTAATEGSYTNTTGHLLLNNSDTGAFASANLTVAAAQSGTGFCASNVTLASWSVPSSTTNPPDKTGGLPTTQSASVTTAALRANLTGSTSIKTNTGHVDTYSWETYGYNTAGQYIEFTLDTSKFKNVSMSFWVANPGAGNGPNNLVLAYNKGSGLTNILTIPSPATAFTQHTQNFTDLTNSGGNTTFRLTATGANNNTSSGNLLYDDISFTGTQTTGCTPVSALPTLSKIFLTSPIAKGASSTLRFTLGNTNPSPLTGVAFTDTLPSGLTVASGTTSACSGTLTTTAPGSIAFSGGTISASGSCQIGVSLTGSSAGSFTNTSGYVSSTESGTNNTASGFGTSSLAVIAPPVMAKAFSPSPIYSGDASTLTFTIINPNPGTALTGVGFNDTLPVTPGAMRVAAAPNAATDGCGSPTFAPIANTTSISLSAATIAAGGVCKVNVDITATTTGTYTNTSTAVTSTNGGTGNTAGADLGVQTVHPAISILKQAATSPNGPWSFLVYVGPGSIIYYRFTIENTGDVPLGPVSVSDDTLDISACKWPDKLPVGTASVDPTASCVLGPITPEVGTVANTATASGWYSGSAYSSAPSTATYATSVVTLAKTAAEPSFDDAGNQLNYSYLVTNNGPDPLAGPLSVSDSNTSVNCPVVTSLAAGASVTCTAVYDITALDMSVGSVTNTAYALLGSTYSNIARETVYRNLADLTVTLSNDTGGYAVKDTPFNWTLTVSNNGPQSATFTDGQVILRDQLPVGADYGSPLVGASSNLTNPAAIDCTIDLSDLLTCTASGASVTLGATTGSFPVTIAVTPAAAGSLADTATVDPLTKVAESNEGNNAGADAVNVSAPEITSLSISKTDSLSNVTPYQAVTYAIVVSNAGPSAANNAVVIDPAASGIALTDVTCGSATGAAACPAAEDVTIAGLQSPGIAIPSLPAGGSVTFTVTATISATSGSVTNTASIAPPAGVINSNPVTTAQDEDTVDPVADLVVTIDDGTTTLLAGSDSAYLVYVTNNGPSPVTGALLTAIPGAGLSAVSAACSTAFDNQCVISPDLGDLTTGGLSLPEILPGEFYEIVLTATVSAETGTVTVDAAVSPPEGTTDSQLLNNAASDIDSIISPNGPNTFTKSSDASDLVRIGDVVHYTLSFASSAGTVRSLVITDTLPQGLAYLGDAAVSGMGSSPAPAVSAPNDGSQPVTLTWSFGATATINSSPVTITYSAQVMDAAANQAGDEKTNTATLDYSLVDESSAPQQTVSSAVTVGEPDLTLTKTILDLPTPDDAGGTVAYQVTLSNAETATATTAYDLRLLDTLPSGLALVTSSIILSNPARLVTDSSDTGTLDLTISSLGVGESLIVTFSATLQDSVQPGQTLINSASVTWTSLPGASAQERTGSGEGPDDYFTDNQASFQTSATGPLTIEKSLAATGFSGTTGNDVTVGEALTYRLDVTLPEGTIPALRLADILPAGLAYEGSTLEVIPGSFNGSVSSSPTVDYTDGQLTIDFSDTVVNGDNDPDNNTFAVTYLAKVEDVPGNVGYQSIGQAQLSNTASVQIGEGDPVSSGTVTVQVVEPQISASTAVTPTSGVQAGDTVTYTVRLTNTGLSPAYDVSASDTLPDGTSFYQSLGCIDQAENPVSGSINGNGANIYMDGIVPSQPQNLPGGISVSVASVVTPATGWVIQPGGFIQCRYGATLLDSILVDGSHADAVNADWFNMPLGTISGQRSYLDGEVPYAADGAQDLAADSFAIAGLSIQKSDGGKSSATISEVLHYTLTLDSPLGTVQALKIADLLPQGLVYLGDAAASGLSSAPSPVVSATNDGSQPVSLTWDFGQPAVVTASPATLTYTARVADVASNLAGDQLSNTASLDYDRADGSAAPQQTAATQVTLVEPVLTLTKQITPSTVHPGDPLTVTLVVKNTGSAPAYNLVLDDPLPGAVYDQTAEDATPAGFGYALVSAGGVNTVRYSAGEAIKIDPGQTRTFSFTTHAAASAASGSHTNTATATQYATLGSGGRSEPPVSASAPLQIVPAGTSPQADLSIVKDDGLTSVDPGSSLTYAIVIANDGPDAADNAVFQDLDAADDGLTLTSVTCAEAENDAACPTSGSALADLTGGGIPLPDLPAGGRLTFHVTAVVSAASGPVSNTASITPPEDVTDPNPGNNTSTDSDTVTPVIPIEYRLYLPLIDGQPAGNPVQDWNVGLGYEDLSLSTGKNDFDYNDWVVEIRSALTYTSASSGLLKQIDLSIAPRALGASYDHQFELTFPAQAFASDGTAVLTITNQKGQVVSTQSTSFAHSTDNRFVIFPHTEEVFAGMEVNTAENLPGKPSQRFAELRIVFNSPFAFTIAANTFDLPHGEGLFFEPSLKVLPTGDQIRRGDMRLLSVPVTNWSWPEEGVQIDHAYPAVRYTAGSPPSFSFPTSWWTSHNNCVYDGVACGTP